MKDYLEFVKSIQEEISIFKDRQALAVAAEEERCVFQPQ